MSGTEYLIDVAARLSGGDKTIGSIDDIAAKLTLAGDASADFETALKTVADKLAAAQAASESANQALKDGTAQYHLLEKAADKAAQAAEKAAVKTGGMSLDQLTSQVNVANTALKEASDKLRLMKKEAADPSAVAQQAAAVKALSASAKDAARQLNMFNSVDKLRQQADAARVALDAEAKALDKLEREAKQASAGVTKLNDTQKQLTNLQAKSRTHFQRQAESMGRMAEALGHLGPLGRLGQQFLMTGKAASQMAGSMGVARAATLGAALATAAAVLALGALGVAFAAGVVSIAKWGIALSEANRKADDLSFSKQSKQFQKNIKKTFGVLNIEPFLKALQRVVDLFDSGTKSGETMSFLFKSIFQPLVDLLPKLLLLFEAFLIGLEIGALEVYIAFKPWIKQMRDLLGLDDTTSQKTIDSFADAGRKAAKVFALVAFSLVVIAVAVAALVVVFGALLTVLTVVVGLALYGAYEIFMMVWDVVKGLGNALGDLAFFFVQLGVKAWEAITNGISKAADYIRNTSWTDIGKNLIQGFIDGILSGFRLVKDVMKNLAKLVLDTPAYELDIHSPSRAAREQARHVPEGYALGIHDGVPAVEDAASGMASASVSAPSAGAKASSTASVNLEGVTFNLYGVKDGPAAVTALRQAWTQLMNGELEQAGGGYA